jgi:hypothetical protein
MSARPGAVAVALHGAPSTRSPPHAARRLRFACGPARTPFSRGERGARRGRARGKGAGGGGTTGRCLGRCDASRGNQRGTAEQEAGASRRPSDWKKPPPRTNAVQACQATAGEGFFLPTWRVGDRAVSGRDLADISATPFVFTRTPTSSPQFRADIAERACEVISASTGLPCGDVL